MLSVEDTNLRSRIEILETLVRLRQGGSSSSVAFTSFIWRPGGVAGGNVYTTWPTLVNAVAAVNGPRFVGVDTDFGVADIPGGNWDLSPPNISGSVVFGSASKATAFTQITIANAAVTIHGLNALIDNLVLINKSTVDVMTGTHFFYMERGCSLFHSVQAGGAAFIRANVGQVATIFLSQFSVIGTIDGGSNAIQAAGGLVFIEVGDDCTIQTNMLSGGGGFLTVRLAGVDCGYGTQAAAGGVTPTGGRQSGFEQIVGGTGKTAVIPVIVSPAHRFLVTVKTPQNDGLTVKYAVLDADLVAGAGGSFKISALSAVGGGDLNLADTSTLYWEAINQGP